MRNFMYFILSPILILIGGIFTFLVAFFVIILNTINLKKAKQHLLKFWGKYIFLIFGKRIDIQGFEKIEKDKKYILVANHGSMFDIMGIMSVCPNVSWLGKAGLMKIPVFKNSLKAINYVPMQSKDLSNTKNMISALISNSGSQTVAIFPEGTRTINGELGRFKKGYIHVLRETEMDILPMTLNGFYKFKPKNRFIVDFSTKLQIVINDIIDSKELIPLDNNEINSKVKLAIKSSYKK